MSAAPGTGTAIPAHAATSRPSTTATRSIPNWRARGNGRRNTPPNPKSCAISASSPTGTSCGVTSALAQKSRRRIGIRAQNAGGSRPTMALAFPAATTSWRPAASLRQKRRRSMASRISRARSISPAAGRMKRSSWPASASPSSARDHQASSRSRCLRSRRRISPFSSAPRTSLCPRIMVLHRRTAARCWKATAPATASRRAGRLRASPIRNRWR